MSWIARIGIGAFIGSGNTFSLARPIDDTSVIGARVRVITGILSIYTSTCIAYHRDTRVRGNTSLREGAIACGGCTGIIGARIIVIAHNGHLKTSRGRIASHGCTKTNRGTLDRSIVTNIRRCKRFTCIFGASIVVITRDCLYLTLHGGCIANFGVAVVGISAIQGTTRHASISHLHIGAVPSQGCNAGVSSARIAVITINICCATPRCWITSVLCTIVVVVADDRSEYAVARSGVAGIIRACIIIIAFNLPGRNAFTIIRIALFRFALVIINKIEALYIIAQGTIGVRHGVVAAFRRNTCVVCAWVVVVTFN